MYKCSVADISETRKILGFTSNLFPLNHLSLTLSTTVTCEKKKNIVMVKEIRYESKCSLNDLFDITHQNQL